MTDRDTKAMGTNSDYFGLLVGKFIADNCHRDTNRLIPAEELREAISQSMGKPLNIRELGRVLNGMGIPRVRRRKKMRRYYAYVGIGFKTDSPYAPKEAPATEIMAKFDGDTSKSSESTSNEKKDADGDTYEMSVDIYTQEKSAERTIGAAWLGTD